MSDDQYPLHVFAQPVDDFGADKGDAFGVHDQFKHAQVGDRINFAGYQEVEGWDKWPGKGFVVQEREFTTRRDSIAGRVIHGLTLTLYIRQT